MGGREQRCNGLKGGGGGSVGGLGGSSLVALWKRKVKGVSEWTIWAKKAGDLIALLENKRGGE